MTQKLTFELKLDEQKEEGKAARKIQSQSCNATNREKSEVKYLLWIGSGPLGTLLSLFGEVNVR